MAARLIWMTPEAEQIISYIARVSNPINQDSTNYAKLIQYMINHNHWSPFEMVNVCFEITTSRAIAAQILRHRSFSFQEFSQRYAEVTELEPVELRKQSEKNRQSSTEIFDPAVPSGLLSSQLVKRSLDIALWTYQILIKLGVAKEVARMVLPMTTRTKLYMNGTLRSWIHYINLRDQSDVQKEHRLIASEIRNILKEIFPVVSEALEW